MRIARILLPLTLTMLVALTGAGIWLLAHQSYPNAVYYERIWVTSTTLPYSRQPAEIWVDPARNVALRITGAGAERTSVYLEPGGRIVQTGAGWSYEGTPLTPDQLRAFVDDNHALRLGGFHALAAARFAHVVGPVVNTALNGSPALRFATRMHGSDVEQLLVWIDARTHDPLQLEVTYPGYGYVQTTISTRRLPASSLPSAFFDPPRQHGSLWDQARTWLAAHLPGH